LRGLGLCGLGLCDPGLCELGGPGRGRTVMTP
jgi:hypothetical protein